MGTDIHTFSETYWAEKYVINETIVYEKWGNELLPSTLIKPNNGRNYELFSYLEDLRNYNEVTPRREAGRGLPTDLSKEGQELIESEKADGHSHGYITCDEIINLYINLEEHAKTETIDQLESWMAYLIGFVPRNPMSFLEHENKRIIYFFDN